MKQQSGKFARKLRQLSFLHKRIKRETTEHIREKLIVKYETLLRFLWQRIGSVKLLRYLVIPGIFSFYTNDSILAQNFLPPDTNTIQIAGDITTAIRSGDIDGDGDIDLFYGDYYSDKLVFIENQSVGGEIIFAQPTEAPFADDFYAYLGYTIGDIDSDGDLDILFYGDYDEMGSVTFGVFKNNGTATSPQLELDSSILTVNGYGLINPHLADIDEDGDLDIIGLNTFENYDSLSSFVFFENNNGVFDSNGVKNPFGLAVPGALSYLGDFTVADIDNDSDLDILSFEIQYIDSTESYSASYFFYENVGTASEPSFDKAVENPFGLKPDSLSFELPHLADVDGDGDVDLIALNFNGVSEAVTVKFYLNEVVSSTQNKVIDIQYEVYPNPATDILSFGTDRIVSEVRIFDLLGRQVWHQEMNEVSAPNISVKALPAGQYHGLLVSKGEVGKFRFQKTD